MIQKPCIAVRPRHVPHLHFFIVVSATRHVGSKKIHPTVVVHIGKVSPHRKPRRMRKRSTGHIGKRHDAVGVRPIVCPKPVRPVKIVGNIEIRPPVLIPVPPRRRKTVMVAAHTGLARNLPERFAGPFVAVEVIVLACINLLKPLAFGQSDHIRVLPKCLGKNRLAIRAPTNGERLAAQRSWSWKPVRDHEQVEITIPIIVRECAHDARPTKIHAKETGAFDEYTPATLRAIQIEPVWTVKTAHIEVKPAVIIDIRP